MGKTFRHYRPESLMEIQTLILTDIQGTLGKMKVTRGGILKCKNKEQKEEYFSVTGDRKAQKEVGLKNKHLNSG